MSSSHPQPFNFAITTSTGYSVVAGTSCTSCNSVNSYNASASSSMQSISGASGRFSVLGGSANGSVVKEDCFLHESNGDAWSYRNQTVIVADQSSGLFTDGISGVLGLGTNGRDGHFDDTVFGTALRQNPGKTNFTYGMALNAPTSPSDTDGGFLHWQQPDPTSYTGEVAWKNATSCTANSSSPSSNAQFDWCIQMDSFVFMSGSIDVSRNGGDLPTILDPFFFPVVFPQSEAQSIYGSIPGASIVRQSATTTVWSVPCNAKMNLTLQFGSVTTTVNETLLVVPQGSQCFGLIEGWTSADEPSFLLGSSIVSMLYVIFSISSSQGSVGVAERAAAASAKKFKTIAIVGITLGTVAFVIMVIIAAMLIIKALRRRPRHIKPQDRIEPFTDPLNSPARLLGSGSGGTNNNSPMPSPDWATRDSHVYSAVPSSSLQSHHVTTHVSQNSMVDVLSGGPSDDAEDTPPPYILSTPWPRQMSIVPISTPPPDRKRRHAVIE